MRTSLQRFFKTFLILRFLANLISLLIFFLQFLAYTNFSLDQTSHKEGPSFYYLSGIEAIS